MATLQTLDGRPLSWGELHAMREDYYARREFAEAAERRSAPCVSAMHGHCSGRMARVDGSANRYDTVLCPCDCHFEDLRSAS